MPGFDGSGPAGAGPKTGRGLGPCNGAIPSGKTGMRGFGRGMGAGRGFGRKLFGWFRSPIPTSSSEEKKDDK